MQRDAVQMWISEQKTWELTLGYEYKQKEELQQSYQ